MIISRTTIVESDSGDTVTICIREGRPSAYDVFVDGGMLANGEDKATFTTFAEAVAEVARQMKAAYQY